MKLFVTTAVAAVFGASAAFAADVPLFSEMDAAGEGQVSLEQMQEHDPSITAEAFAGYDADGDGYLDAGEYSAWAADASAPVTGQGDVDLGGEFDADIDTGIGDTDLDTGADLDAGAGVDFE